MTEQFPLYVMWWAVGCVALMATWIFLIHCIDEMVGAWRAMRGREWRWPEGPLLGPGDKGK